MLVPVDAEGGWKFAAFGKHPGEKDYIRLGSATPLLEGIAEWVEKGYAGIDGKRRGMAEAVSWRFWTKGIGPEGLVCGVVRDSGDRLGRPYPLLVLGTGALADWEGNWDLLPYACLTVWQRMEYAGAQRYEEIGRFESAIRGLHPPTATWSDFSARREREAGAMGARSGTGSTGKAVRREGEEPAPEETFRFIRIDGGDGHDPFPAAVDRQYRLRRDCADVPNAVFFGGTMSRTYLGVFRRPVAAADFARIWNVTEAEEGSLERGAN